DRGSSSSTRSYLRISFRFLPLLIVATQASFMLTYLYTASRFVVDLASSRRSPKEKNHEAYPTCTCWTLCSCRRHGAGERGLDPAHRDQALCQGLWRLRQKWGVR